MQREPAMPWVHAAAAVAQRSGTSEVFIGIDVQADGKLGVTVWRGGRRDSIYVMVDADKALRRVLPQALEEAVALAQRVVASGQGVRRAA